MGLEEIQNDLYVSLNNDAKKLYANFVEAEKKFFNFIDGDNYVWTGTDFLPEIPQDYRCKCIKIIIKNDLAKLNYDTMSNLLQAKQDFYDYIVKLAREQNINLNVGKISTNNPLLITPNGKIELPLNSNNIDTTPVNEITWRTKIAYRSTNLTLEEVETLLLQKISKKEEHRNNAYSNSQYNRSNKIENEITQINKDLQRLKKIAAHEKNLICHKTSGHAFNLNFKWHKRSTIKTTIPNICFVVGDDNTSFKEAHKRPNRKSRLEFVDKIDVYNIYRQK